MDTNLIGVISIFVIIAIVAFLILKVPVIRKYWKYLLVVFPAIILLIFKLLFNRKRYPKQDTRDILTDDFQEIKESLLEVDKTVAIKMTAVRQKNADKLEELKKVTKISDKKLRRKRLAEMMEL